MIPKIAKSVSDQNMVLLDGNLSFFMECISEGRFVSVSEWMNDKLVKTLSTMKRAVKIEVTLYGLGWMVSRWGL